MKYPVYIISKGRWKSRFTSKAFEKMNVPYYIVVEPQELKEYANVIDPKKILTLPFSNLGQGSIPARNWVWDHSISIGAKRHWIFDDNIRAFFRFNKNLQVRVTSGAIFKAMEDFVDRYENVALAGPQYDYFVPRKVKKLPLTLNTRVYSAILIDNNLKHRWRGRYNEDTDLSIRALKDGLCTILFNAFLQQKTGTMIMKGGNTEELYKIKDGRLKMARSLLNQHPDIVKVVYKYNKWHHQVNYTSFKRNQFILKQGLEVSKANNEYGMTFKKH